MTAVVFIYRQKRGKHNGLVLRVSKTGRNVTSTPTLIARVKRDALNFHGREALSAPSELRIEFTSLRMLSGREVHGG